jgi:hypothetical protein
MSPSGPRGGSGEMNVFTAMLGAAALVLLAAVVWVMLANMDQSGSMFGVVSSR